MGAARPSRAVYFTTIQVCVFHPVPSIAKSMGPATAFENMRLNEIKLVHGRV
jgi:hypothetical protein